MKSTRVGLMMSCVAFVMGACGTVGDKDFACPGRPPGVRCMSATEVYRATHNTDVVEPTSVKALGDDPNAIAAISSSPPRHQEEDRKARERRSAPADAGAAAMPARAGILTPAVERPIPIRRPAQVLRAWIAPWEDARGVLHSGGYAFVEIVSRRWSFGEAATAEPVRFFSIQGTAAETKETVGKDQSAPKARTGASERPNSSTLPKTGASK